MPTSSSLISLLYVCSVLSTATHTYDLYKYRSQYSHVHIYRHIDILYVAMLWVDHIMPTPTVCFPCFIRSLFYCSLVTRVTVQEFLCLTVVALCRSASRLLLFAPAVCK